MKLAVLCSVKINIETSMFYWKYCSEKLVAVPAELLHYRGVSMLSNHLGLAPGLICVHSGVLNPGLFIDTSLITSPLAARPLSCWPRPIC